MSVSWRKVTELEAEFAPIRSMAIALTGGSRFSSRRILNSIVGSILTPSIFGVSGLGRMSGPVVASPESVILYADLPISSPPCVLRSGPSPTSSEFSNSSHRCGKEKLATFFPDQI
jgi:hypothetical protein